MLSLMRRLSSVAVLAATLMGIALLCCRLTTVDAALPVKPLTPSLSPTMQPSITMAPSISMGPTMGPSETPSIAPTFSSLPTSKPSSSAPTLSQHPTLLPSQSPTFKPSSDPTTVPTRNPTHAPTFKPTVLPSMIPTAPPSEGPTFKPSISYLPTADPTFSPTPKASDAKMFVNQTILNIYNMTSSQWTYSSKGVLEDTVFQTLYNFEMCIESIEVTNVAPDPRASPEGSNSYYSSSFVSYTVFYIPSVFDKSASDLYLEMSNALSTAVTQGAFNSILHYEASIKSNSALLNAESFNISSTSFTTPTSSDSNDGSNDELQTDEQVGLIFGIIFILFVTLWYLFSHMSRKSRLKAAAAAVNNKKLGVGDSPLLN